MATLEVQHSTGPAARDVSRVVSEHHLNIVAARTSTTPTGEPMAFDVELADPTHLLSLIGRSNTSMGCSTPTASSPASVRESQ